MSKDTKIEVDAALINAGDLDGSMVRVAVDLAAVFVALDSKYLAEEIQARVANDDPDMVELVRALAPDETLSWDDDEIEDPIFKALSEWDRDELRKAVREDDGRRAIDVLKRAAA